ncbi:MAG: uracil-DNA glycosylase [Candidatus Aminicenantes bacterium]|nr:uracil-DNA glycosylase [Candidatus Aminicenantes bacterium]
MNELDEILKFYREIGAGFLEYHRENPLKALNDLNREIGNCTKCKLYESKKNYVPGEGSAEPGIIFIGEGPGETEDNLGRPFVGRAGELLDKLIDRMGYSRETVFIGNIVKCRPPGNRNPLPEEVAACKPYLESQIDILKPKVIVCLGKVALNNLLGQNYSIMKERGKLFYFKDIPVIPTYHPAYILRQTTKDSTSKAKWDTWNDMKKVLEIVKKSR